MASSWHPRPVADFAAAETATFTVFNPASGLHVVTADLSFRGREFKQWTEALVRIR